MSDLPPRSGRRKGSGMDHYNLNGAAPCGSDGPRSGTHAPACPTCRAWILALCAACREADHAERLAKAERLEADA